ncbi:MAG: T9SS type A sorting domain-containing protein [Patescibacteria group bacterium]|nr:T9SS type A sorting domain-containing protein [Patescibacteria group bacterium]
MKKSLTVLIVMLIMSIGNVTLAQTWAEYDLPASATAVAVSDHYIFVFTTDQYYEVGFPLTPSGSTLPWAQMLIPGTGKIKGGACTPDGIVFALRENGDLWRLINGQWENIFQNIDGLTGLKGNRFFAWSHNTIYEYLGGFTQMPFDGVKAIGFNDNNVFVFTENGNYSGPNSWSLGPAEDLPNFYPMDAAMTDNEYVVVGSAIGNGAWHQSPPDACVPFTHVLTGGVINSVAALKDTAYVGGQLGNKGMLFNTSDMSGIYIVPEPVLQVRSNNVGVVVAVSASKLYVYGNTATVGNKQPITVTPTKLIIAPNPVQDGCLRVIAPEATEVYLSDLSGRLIAGTRLDKGVNEINVAFLPSGIYLLDGQKVIIP